MSGLMPALALCDVNKGLPSEFSFCKNIWEQYDGFQRGSKDQKDMDGDQLSKHLG